MGKLEQIRGAISDMSEDFAKDVLATLLASSSSGSVYDNANQRQIQGSSNIKSVDSVDFANFAQAISYLKGKFKFKELSRFTTEADLVYVDTGDRKVLLTDRDDPARFDQPQRRAVEDTYSSEDEYFENAFEPSYHRAANKDNQSQSQSQQQSQSSSNVEKTIQNNDNNNNAQGSNETQGGEPKGNSRFSSLEL